MRVHRRRLGRLCTIESRTQLFPLDGRGAVRKAPAALALLIELRPEMIELPPEMIDRRAHLGARRRRVGLGLSVRIGGGGGRGGRASLLLAPRLESDAETGVGCARLGDHGGFDGSARRRRRLHERLALARGGCGNGGLGPPRCGRGRRLGAHACRLGGAGC